MSKVAAVHHWGPLARVVHVVAGHREAGDILKDVHVKIYMATGDLQIYHRVNTSSAENLNNTNVLKCVHKEHKYMKCEHTRCSR